jgi:TRAP-type C4-dicarboxylate transport system permease large subunit
MLGGARLLGYFLAAANLPNTLALAITESGLPPTAVLFFILIFQLIVGAIMPGLTVLIIVIPIFFPVAMAMGYDPLWFGIWYIVLGHVGAITPPFGISIFALKGVAKEVPISTIFIGVIPFVIATLVTLAIIWVFPGLVTWLPYLFR